MVVRVQGNPTKDRISSLLGSAGSGDLGPILKGLGGHFTLDLKSGETLTDWRITWTNVNDAGNTKQVIMGASGDHTDYQASSDGLTHTIPFKFGLETGHGATAERNFVEWKTRRASYSSSDDDALTKRQFFVQDLPSIGSLYINNQEAQNAKATVNISTESAETDPYAGYATLSFNILPNFGDEFFSLHEYIGNRYANTRRTWGGARTAEVFIAETAGGSIVVDPTASDYTTPAISERNIELVTSYYWNPPSYGTYAYKVRLRSKLASSYPVDIDGSIIVTFGPCS